MREKPFYESALFWVALGGVAVVIGGIFVAVGVAQVASTPSITLFGDGWFDVGLVGVAVGALMCLYALALYMAHRHIEGHFGTSSEGMVAQTPTSQPPVSESAAQLELGVPTAPREKIDLDLVGLLEGWADFTSAQEDQFVENNLRGKLATFSGQVADVWNNPPSIILEVNRKQPGPIQKTRLNVQLLFRAEHLPALMLLKKGDSFRARGEVLNLARNLYQVPQLHIGNCELIKDLDTT